MKPYRAAPDDPNHHEYVTDMFDRIAPRYDRLNKVMSLGLDIWWRRQLAGALDPDYHRRVLDVCTGTGDVAILLRKRGHSVAALDGARDMLSCARSKGGRLAIGWCEGNALSQPYPDNAFDAVTISFGIRNIADRVAALREFHRLVRPGGALVVLEALEPKSAIWGTVMKVYEKTAFPAIGAVFARDRKAYEYLARSIAGFGTVSEFEAEEREAGWEVEESRWLTGGSVVLFHARKP